MDTIAALKDSPLFADLDILTIENLAEYMELRTFRAGQVIAAEGDVEDASRFYVVLSGQVRIAKGSGDSAAQIGLIEAGQHFGEMGIILEEGRTATATAATDCALFTLTMDDVERALADDPLSAAMFLRALAVVMARRLKATTDELAALRERLEA